MRDDRPHSHGALNLWRLLTSVKGRIRRREFWLGWLCVSVLCIAVWFTPNLRSTTFLLPLWPLVALSVKRLRDMERPTYLVIMPAGLIIAGFILIVCYIGLLIYMTYLEDAALDILAAAIPVIGIGLLTALLIVAYLVWLGLAPDRRNIADSAVPGPES